ncbi:hypothetical protein HDV02_006396 [Globomyces sp. JEL0801]|nr:hypothetical protein HDV02_006396 [Globomyces sp. JEL0801]
MTNDQDIQQQLQQKEDENKNLKTLLTKTISEFTAVVQATRRNTELVINQSSYLQSQDLILKGQESITADQRIIMESQEKCMAIQQKMIDYYQSLSNDLQSKLTTHQTELSRLVESQLEIRNQLQTYLNHDRFDISPFRNPTLFRLYMVLIFTTVMTAILGLDLWRNRAITVDNIGYYIAFGFLIPSIVYYSNFTRWNN